MSHQTPDATHSTRRASNAACTPDELLAELAQILAAGYLRLCADAARGAAQSGARQQRSGATEGQNCAPAGAGEGP